LKAALGLRCSGDTVLYTKGPVWEKPQAVEKTERGLESDIESTSPETLEQEEIVRDPKEGSAYSGETPGIMETLPALAVQKSWQQSFWTGRPRK
jgi:hypothetical protein